MKQVAWHEAGGGGGIHCSSLHAALSISVPFSCLPPTPHPAPCLSFSSSLDSPCSLFPFKPAGQGLLVYSHPLSSTF